MPCRRVVSQSAINVAWSIACNYLPQPFGEGRPLLDMLRAERAFWTVLRPVKEVPPASAALDDVEREEVAAVVHSLP